MATREKDGLTRPRPWSARRLRVMLGRLLHNDQLLLLMISLLIGVAAAYGAIAFRELYLAIRWLAFGTMSEDFVNQAATLPAWQRVLAPTLGGLVVGLFVRFMMPQQRPQGVADVIESVALRSGRMGLGAGLGAAAVSAASIGVGASVGREGPVVHLGATLSSLVSQRIGLSRSQAVTLLGCGVAAAISASFNAPIAGVFFALEVVIGHYALSAFAPIVLASVVGTMISRIHFGDFPAFIIPDHADVSLLEFPAFALLGIVSAALAIIFIRSVEFAQDTVERIPAPAWTRPMMAGLVVGLIAIPLPHVLGVGYGSTDAALKEMYSLELLIALIVAKTAATAVCLGSGFGGGVFSPSLFLGAMLGGAFGIVATAVFPEFSTGVTGYSLVGMGAVAGAVLGAPISTILIVFELTADYTLTIAVMVGVVFASVITQQVSEHRSFFHWQLARRGVRIDGGRAAGVLSVLRLRDVVSNDFDTVPASADMMTIRRAIIAAPHARLYVVDDHDALQGVISLAELPEEAFDVTPASDLTALDVAHPDPPVLEIESGVEDALRRMRDWGEEHVAVVEDTESMKLVGIANQVDALTAYNRALMRARQEERGEV